MTIISSQIGCISNYRTRACVPASVAVTELVGNDVAVPVVIGSSTIRHATNVQLR